METTAPQNRTAATQSAGITSALLASVKRPGPKKPPLDSPSTTGSISAAAATAAAATNPHGMEALNLNTACNIFVIPRGSPVHALRKARPHQEDDADDCDEQSADHFAVLFELAEIDALHSAGGRNAEHHVRRDR